jgi:hypothetical protein
MKTALNLFAAVAMTGLSMTLSQTASAWTTNVSCQGGTAGKQVAQGGAGQWTNAFTSTLYSTAQVPAGATQSCQMGISAGSDGWDQWGGIYMFPTHLGPGSDLWIRLAMYVPAGFNFNANPWLKFMRVHTASPSNTNQGYNDLYINPSGGTIFDQSLGKDISTPFSFYYEGQGMVRGVGTSANNIAFGKWETYEIHYTIDTTPKNQGGKGEIKIWKNNALIADLTDQKQLVDSSTYAESFYMFTYWNGNAPATQNLYINDVIVTTDTPSNKDAAGNPFIGAPVLAGSAGTGSGTGTGGGTTTPPPPTTATPNPPSDVTVQ